MLPMEPLAAYGRRVAGSRRLTIRSIDADPRAAALRHSASHLGLADVGDVKIADVVFLDGELTETELQRLHGVLVDPLLQRGSWDLPTSRGIEIMRQPGVTDTDADAVRHAAERLGITIRSASTGTRVEFEDRVAPADAKEIVSRLVANRVVDRWVDGAIEPLQPPADAAVSPATSIEIRGLDPDELQQLNAERGLSLDPGELAVIQDHFADAGRDPTDVELEMLAQTWSEHCAHKTFRAALTTTGGSGDESADVTPLLTQLRVCT